jgi:hypothetical protein
LQVPESTDNSIFYVFFLYENDCETV